MTCQFNFQYDSCGSNTTNEMSIGPLLGKDGFIVVYDITNYVSMNNKLTKLSSSKWACGNLKKDKIK
jgi:hypothetical protein